MPSWAVRLAVRFATIADPSDFDEVAAEIAEEDAVVLGAEAIKRRIDALETADVALFRFKKAGQCAEDLDGDRLRNRTEFGLGLFGKGDPFSRSSVGRLMAWRRARPAVCSPSSPSPPW